VKSPLKIGCGPIFEGKISTLSNRGGWQGPIGISSRVACGTLPIVVKKEIEPFKNEAGFQLIAEVLGVPEPKKNRA